MLLMAGAGLAAPAPHNARTAEPTPQVHRRTRNPFGPILLPKGNKSQTKVRTGRHTDADITALQKAQAKRDRKAAKRQFDAARTVLGYHPQTTKVMARVHASIDLLIA